jgi:hypothetical protein
MSLFTALVDRVRKLGCQSCRRSGLNRSSALPDPRIPALQHPDFNGCSRKLPLLVRVRCMPTGFSPFKRLKKERVVASRDEHAVENELRN